MGPGSPHDYRYLQSAGPWDIAQDDTLHLAWALSIGEGLDGLRANIQKAYNCYWKLFDYNNMPYIIDYHPQMDTIITYFGELIRFKVKGIDKENDHINYTWQVDDGYYNKRDTVHVFNSAHFSLGEHYVAVDVSDYQYHNIHSWTVIIKPAKKYELAQNYPNPFNDGTKIPFELKNDGNVKITIYDILGRKIRTVLDENLTFGKHETSWDGKDEFDKAVSSGFYFYQIQAGEYSDIGRMLLLK